MFARMAATEPDVRSNADEELLAKLGYKQELERSWSGFQNFAISFTIISILAGCFTTYGQAWNNGGPVAISLGLAADLDPDPDHRLLHVRAASAYPTAGGIYWWASKLGGRRVGLVHRLVQPDRPRSP